jgi:protein dithiol oxidoreductase (disulfide-forming)
MNMRKLSAVIFLAVAAFALSGVSNAEEFRVNADYTMVSPPVPAAGPGKVQVVELFWYGCPHCFHFDPILDGWLEDKPANVEFVRLPAIFNNPRWKLHAQAFYTAEVLEIMNKFHKPFFNAVQNQHRKMATKDEIGKFFEQLDVDAKTFDDAFESFAVQTKVRRAADLTRQYNIDGVPTIIVNGKYRVEAGLAKSYERMISITDGLIARETK